MFHRHVAVPQPHATLPIESLDREDIVRFGPPLSEIVTAGMRVTIAFTDATRRCPDDRLIGRLLRELDSCGVRREDVTLLCATGLHRPMSEPERRAKLGMEIGSSMTIVDHAAGDRDGLVQLVEIDGLPVVVNRRCVDTDLLLATGVVEPHQYAGYSGGAKTVVIGCAGEATIAATHGAAMIDRDGVRLGAVAGNPFQMFVREAGRAIGLRYVINVLLDDNGGLVAAAEGDPDMVHDHLAAIGRGIFEVEVERPIHAAIAGVPEAKGVNLYQASRAATYLALADRTPLLEGAPIIIPAILPEGAGEGEGEKRFFELLSGARSPGELLKGLRVNGFPGGAQRAYILARVLDRHPVIVAGAADPDLVRSCHMRTAPDIGAALAQAEEIARERFGHDQMHLLDVPNALVTICRMGSRFADS